MGVGSVVRILKPPHQGLGRDLATERFKPRKTWQPSNPGEGTEDMRCQGRQRLIPYAREGNGG